MAKTAIKYVCTACGAEAAKWAGKCADCNEWNTLEEDAFLKVVPGKAAAVPKGSKLKLVGLKGENTTPPRLTTGMRELDLVAGGGFVRGSALLVGGDPGIGKSTLLLQAMAAIANNGEQVVYISGEEAIEQVRLRANRLGLDDAPVLLAAETNLSDILSTLTSGEPPAAVVIDSIQTMWTPHIDSAPGSVSQVRAVSEALIRFAKQYGTTVFLVGHVTKEGQIAGPRVIEHMVDTVLYFEGDRGHQFRILRAVKNRFGAIDEIGVFEMSGGGLVEVENPSALFAGDLEEPAPGSAVFAGIEGTRPLLVEVQALVAPSSLGTPRRAVVGWESSRLAMILAVLEAHCGVALASHDVYLNVAGGMRIREPAADFAVAAALVSSLTSKPLPARTVLFGEISLSGAVRPASRTGLRLKEAEKLGFENAVLAAGADAHNAETTTLCARPMDALGSLVAFVAGTTDT